MPKRLQREHNFVTRPGPLGSTIESCVYCVCARCSGFYWLFPHRSTAAPVCTRNSADNAKWRVTATEFNEQDMQEALGRPDAY